MEFIKSIFSHIAEGIDVIGIVILIYGFGRAIIRFFKTEVKNDKFNLKMDALQAIRCEIGIYILLALDFLIASDIIHTIFDLGLDQLLELSVMIVVRTGIGYFLGKEIQEIEDK